MKKLLLIVLASVIILPGCESPQQEETTEIALPQEVVAAEVVVDEPVAAKPAIDGKSVTLTQMFFAAEAGDMATFKAAIDANPEWLHSRESRWEVPPMNYAAWTGQYDIVKLCIERGGDVNAHHAKWKWYALHEAAYKGHVEVAKLLLEHGAEIDARRHDGATAVLVAAKRGEFEMVDMLLKHGAGIGGTDELGWSFLHLVAGNVNDETAALLIERGADVKMKIKSGHTPLHWAATGEIAKLLIDKGADVKVTSEDGRTPLHLASYFGDDDVVKVLLAGGAKVNAEDGAGRTPLDLALLENHGNTAALLRSHGALSGKTPADSSANQPITQVGENGQFIANGETIIPFAVWMQPMRQLGYHSAVGMDCIMFPSYDYHKEEEHKRYVAAVKENGLHTFSYYDENVANSSTVWGWQGEYGSQTQSRRAYEHLRRVDPKRVIICNFTGHELVKQENSDFYRNAFNYVDCITPHVWAEMFKDKGEEADLHYIATLVKNVRELTKDRKRGELCIFVDINTHEWHKDGINYPAPTSAEFKYTAWSALIAGADGICLFPISFQPFVFNQTTAEIGNMLPGFVEEVKGFTDVLAADESGRSIVIEADDLSVIGYTTRHYDGDDYVFLINGPEGEQTVRLKVAGMGNTVTLHDALVDKAVDTENGVFERNVPALGLCIWKISDK